LTQKFENRLLGPTNPKISRSRGFPSGAKFKSQYSLTARIPVNLLSPWPIDTRRSRYRHAPDNRWNQGLNAEGKNFVRSEPQKWLWCGTSGFGLCLQL